MMYIIKTESGHLWLIENAASIEDASAQYLDGGAEPFLSIAETDDEEMAEYLRDQGQAS